MASLKALVWSTAERKKRAWSRSIAVLQVALFGTIACATGETLPSGNAGSGDASVTTGGSTGSGGGSSNTGGVGAGGATASGGSTNTGGTPGTGGTPSTGGAASTGGTTPTGGAASTGGAVSTGGKASTGGTPSTGGSIGTGGAISTGGTGAVDPVGNANRNPGFVDLSVTMGAALPASGSPVTPAPPLGWTWYQIDGAVCRDGSPTGIYVHNGTTDKLVIYLEGGGACMNSNYCSFNPANVNQILGGDGQTVFGTAGGAAAGRQQPGVYTNGTGVQGIFDTSNAANPVKDWNQVYVPYCTGDVHFGTRKNATVPGSSAPQQFVGNTNMRLFLSRIVPTFKSKVSRVLLTGASAGGFGAALNFSMVQDSFGDVRVDLIDDSGPPFDDAYMPPCVQKRWREQWGFAGALPPDCTECASTDGGHLSKLSDFLLRKHKQSNVAFVSTMQDEVIRLFFSAGLSNCMNYDTANPVAIVLLQGDPTVYFAAQPYTDGLNALRASYVGTGRLATYYMGGAAPNVQWHQHIFRSRFYDKGGANPSPGIESPADFVKKFLTGTVEQVGP
jgi:hypothetical protein